MDATTPGLQSPALCDVGSQRDRYEISQRFFIDAAHTLHRSIEEDASRRIHGHTYEVEISIGGSPDPRSGMVVDLGHLRAEIARIREMLDHRLLDDVPDLGPATLENLCAFIWKQVQRAFPQTVAVVVERKASGDKCVLRVS